MTEDASGIPVPDPGGIFDILHNSVGILVEVRQRKYDFTRNFLIGRLTSMPPMFLLHLYE